MTVLIVGAPCATVAAERAPIEVQGNHQFTDDEIKKMLPADAIDVHSPVKFLNGVQTAYLQRGHLLATFRIEREGSDSTLILRIDEGEPAQYRSIAVKGEENYSEEKVRNILGLQPGDRFRPDELKRAIDGLLEMYDADGYPFAQVWIDSLELEANTNSVGLSMHVVEGGRQSLSHVKFVGLEHTREELAVKLSGLKTGESYSGERLRESYLRLTSSGVFDAVSYPAVRISPDGGVEALIEVVEPLRNNSFSGAIGYADREAETERVLSGVVRLDLTNIGGSLRDLGIHWRNDGQGRNETRLAFRERFFLGRRMSMGLRLEQIGQDTLYTWQSVGLESSAPIGRLWGGLFGVDLGLFGDRNTFSEGDVSNSIRFRIVGGNSFVKGKEDRGAYIDLRARHAYAAKKIRRRGGGGDESVSQYIFEARLSASVGLTRNVHGFAEMNYRGLESGEDFVPLSEQFYLGGAGTLRGYRENQFHGRRIAYVRSELRVGRSARENGYVFVDGGYVLQESVSASATVTKEELYPVGYGFGLRTQSRIGNIDISFGIGDRLSLRQTKVHVILDRSF
ncbi:MAG: BamA/TamA family outer membrane protein [Candidatus Latescibacterota bacterium]|nr:MAG: BamA/TamA family outer membrane protein [Candidatus Latescibacterota bacterium]